MIRGAAGRYPSGLRLGARGTFGDFRRFALTGLAAHSGLPEMVYGLGTWDRWRARSASGGILPDWGIRGHAAGSGSIRKGRFNARHSAQVALFEGKIEEG